MQRPSPPTVIELDVGELGRGTSPFGIDRDERVRRPVDRVDPRQTGLEQVDGAQLSCLEGPGGVEEVLGAWGR